MNEKIVFMNRKAEDEWREKKLLLEGPCFEVYGFYDYNHDIYYKKVGMGEYIEISESELDICTVLPARGIFCFIGNGNTDIFKHFSPRSNGYPEYPWDGKYGIEHVYIISSGVELDDWTERYGFWDANDKTKHLEIEWKLEAKLEDLVDTSFIEHRGMLMSEAIEEIIDKRLKD